MGRWLNRDPIEENGGVNLYISFANAATNNIDPLGNEIYSMQIKGDGDSEVYKHSFSFWRNDLELMYKDLGGGPQLGLHVGKGFKPTFFSEWCRLYGWCDYKGKTRALGMYKFEITINWCGKLDYEDWPKFTHYVSKLKIWKTSKLTQERDTLYDEPIERQDGYINQIVGISEKLKNDDGTFKALAYDAPRFSSLQFNDPAIYRYYFEAEWRITAEDKESLWESKISLSFSFDDDGNSNDATSSFSVISEPVIKNKKQ